MTPRERMIMTMVVAVAVCGGMWLYLVSPERDQVTSLDAAVQSAQGQLQTSRGQVTEGEAARVIYPQDFAANAALNKAIPPFGDQLPELIKTLDRLAKHRQVDTRGIDVAEAGPSPGSGGSFGTITFSYRFIGGYVDLQRFLHSIQDFTLTDGRHVLAKNRLLTVQSINLTGVDPAVIRVTLIAYTYQLSQQTAQATSGAGVPPATAAPGSSAPTASTTAATRPPSTAHHAAAAAVRTSRGAKPKTSATGR